MAVLFSPNECDPWKPQLAGQRKLILFIKMALLNKLGVGVLSTESGTTHYLTTEEVPDPKDVTDDIGDPWSWQRMERDGLRFVFEKD